MIRWPAPRLRRPQLKLRDRRALVLGGLVLLPVLFYYQGVQPYLVARSEAASQVARERALYARELSLLADADRYPILSRQARRAVAAEMGRLFEGPNEVTAAAELATYIEASAEESQVLLERAESRRFEGDSVRAAGGIERLEVDVAGEGDLQGVLGFLGLLEGGKELVYVDDLMIAPRTGSSRVAGESDSTLTDPLILGFSAVVVGFALVEPSVDPEGPHLTSTAGRLKAAGR